MNWKEDHLSFMHKGTEDFNQSSCELCAAYEKSRLENTLNGGIIAVRVDDAIKLREHLK